MAFIQRANVILEVKDDQVERFLDQGYDVVDETGNVIQKSVPQDLGTLRKAYLDNMAEIDALKVEIKKLKASKKTSTKSKVVEDDLK